MAAHTICPPGSEPELAATYKARGTESLYDTLPLYTVGSPENPAVIVVYDIFGWNGGRIRLITDQIADAGFYAVLPDFYRGNPWSESRSDDRNEWLKLTPPSVLLKDFEIIYKFLNEKEVKKIGAIGFCWGCFVLVLASSTGRLSAGVNIHPSLGTGARVFNIPETEQADKVTCPQLFLPCTNDPANVKPGGEVQQLLNKKPFGHQCEYYALEEVNHGFLPRGDISKPEVARNVKFAMETSINFLTKHLKH